MPNDGARAEGDAAKAVSENAPRTPLIVVGAAVGMGRWLVEKVFSSLDWLEVVLVDVDERKSELEDAASTFQATASVINWGEHWYPLTNVVTFSTLESAAALVVLAVPPHELGRVAQRLASTRLHRATVVVVSDRLEAAIAEVSGALPHCDVVGLHPLFERSATSLQGQIVYIVPAHRDRDVGVKITDLLRAAGGVVTVGTAQRHDHSMIYVQAAAHQTLLNFVDVLTKSGLDLERDLWAARTPLFESLFGLAARVLDPSQRSAIEAIQTGPAGLDAASMLAESADSTFQSIADPSNTSRRLEEISEGLSGSLFSTARHVAQVAVEAAQATRTELSKHFAQQDLVGVRLTRRPEVVHVGRIIEVGTTEVIVEDLLLSSSGRGAVLAVGAGLVNKSRVGAQGSTRKVRLSLGQLSLVVGAELDRELEHRLAFIRRDVRFLVPESVSGTGVVSALRSVPGTRGHKLVSQVVRTGQRAVVVRVEIRADHDLDDMVERLRSIVQDIYAWPDGICRPARRATSRVLYLGPPGTFSEVAARHCAKAAQLAGGTLEAVDSFDAALEHLSDEAIAVLPISSSSSGLVTRAFEALWRTDRDVKVGGMVDVSVRFDAYIPVGSSLDQLRGAQLFSHPQALAQCQQFISRWGFQTVLCGSTAEALRTVATSAEPAVALAAAGASLQGLPMKVGEREVDDLAGSITRFLIVGTIGAFGELPTESAPTTRSVYLIRNAADDNDAFDLPVDGVTAAYEEILADTHGNLLLITSRTGRSLGTSVRKLGSTPWSPRTPVVRVGP